MSKPQCFCDECEKAMAYAEARIIKLLEEDCECLLVISEHYTGCYNHHLIALIKGEQE